MFGGAYIRRAGVDSGFFVGRGAPLENYPDFNYHFYGVKHTVKFRK